MKNKYDLIDGFLAGLRPEPIITVSEWADENRMLDAKAAAEPGLWRTARAPYLREIMDSLSTANSIEEVIVMKGAQLGLTEAGNNWVGYIIHNAPAPTLMVMPTDGTMKRNSQLRIDPMIEATPVLRTRVKPARAKDSGNTVFQKDFPGGVLMMAGANSAVGLRSMPVRNLFLDEVDGYPADLDGEGSPISLAEARTRTFKRRKIYKISTPTIKGSSVIEAEFEDTDQRFFFVCCPHCGAEQTLSWAQIKWDKELPKKKRHESARYECLHCQKLIEERFKTKMLNGGTWRVTKPENVSIKRVGYHINSLYSPWYTWAEIVKDWIEAQGKTAKLKAFVNTVLGEVWEGEGEAPEWQQLYNRREDFDGAKVVPNSVGVITCGVDIQKDRIEAEIVGWAEGNESYSLGYHVLPGNTEAGVVWDLLADLLATQFTRQDGLQMPIRTTCIDTGYLAQTVYKFARKYAMDTVIPIKGQDAQRVPISAPQAVQRKLKSGKRAGSTRLINVGVSILKSELYGWLKLQYSEGLGYPAGYPHFPFLYDEHYFKMLTAEKMVFVANARGFGRYEWVKHFERNEALDCRVYARAAAIAVGIDRLSAADWARLAPQHKPAESETSAELAEGEEIAAHVTPAPVATPPVKARTAAPPISKKKSSFWK